MKRALILNNYMHLRGGGERSTLAFALALKGIGFDVEIASRHDQPGNAEICQYFGQEFSHIATRKIAGRNVTSYVKRNDIAVFVNHSNGEVPRNAAPFGIYVQMFPLWRISRWRTPLHYRRLQSYQLMVNNSAFTKGCTDRWWDFPRHRSEVLYPPLTSLFHELRPALLANHAARKKQIVNIGRFSRNHRAHYKNQPLLLEAFMAARSRFPELADWSLVMVGPTMPDSAEYVRELERKIRLSGAAAVLRHDLSIKELSLLMSESSMYVHTTGAFYAGDSDAFRCEHFGLSIAEAMSHGCIPLVYDRGGILEILKPNALGFTYRTFDELVEGIRSIALLHENNALAELRARNIAAVACLNIADFTQALRVLLEQHGLGAGNS